MCDKFNSGQNFSKVILCPHKVIPFQKNLFTRGTVANRHSTKTQELKWKENKHTVSYGHLLTYDDLISLMKMSSL